MRSEDEIKTAYAQINSLYKDAVNGDEKAVQALHQTLEQVRSNHANIPLLNAYHGSIMILIARDKTNPLEKLRWSKAGLKLLDDAVIFSPHNFMIRLLRGKAAHKLPEKHFNRGQTAIDDYTFLIKSHGRGEGFLNSKAYWQLIYELGEVYYRMGRNQDAGICWRKLKNETQDPAFQRLLLSKLKLVEGKPAVETRTEPEGPFASLLRRIVNEAQNQIPDNSQQTT